jgi:hypothetical protein
MQRSIIQYTVEIRNGFSARDIGFSPPPLASAHLQSFPTSSADASLSARWQPTDDLS